MQNIVQDNNIRLCTNYVFKIIEIDDENKTLTLTNTSDEVTITYEHLKYMSLLYSSTAHSTQGTTIHQPFTIFDCNVAYVDRRYVWTALTRASSFKDVTIFKHSEQEKKALEKCKLKQYFDLKIKNYIEQDIVYI